MPISLRTAVIGLAGAGLLLGPGWMSGAFSREPTPHQLQRRLAARVHPGMPRARVEAVLDSLRVEHSREAAGRDTLYAIWRNTGRSLVCDASIQGRFFFDPGGLLTHDSLAFALTCP